MKTCIACNRLLPLREFHRDCHLKSGYKDKCRHCINSVPMPTHQQQDELAEATKAALKIHSLLCLARAFRGKDHSKDTGKIRKWENHSKYEATADEMDIRIGDMWALAGMRKCWFGK